MSVIVSFANQYYLVLCSSIIVVGTAVVPVCFASLVVARNLKGWKHAWHASFFLYIYEVCKCVWNVLMILYLSIEAIGRELWRCKITGDQGWFCIELWPIFEWVPSMCGLLVVPIRYVGVYIDLKHWKIKSI